MGIKDKLNKTLSSTLDKGEDLLKKSKEKLGKDDDEEEVEELKPKTVVGTKSCVGCGAPVPLDSPACPYCTTANANYIGENTSSSTNSNSQQDNSTMSHEEPKGPRCPYCGNPYIAKKKRSAAKHTAAAMMTGGLSLVTLAAPNKKYKCPSCNKTFKL